ncbi:MAG TPA: hypothetical protein VJS11_01100 [Acidobacteriaceae bacterium]|nr:hypothetical protein [Acidobacteriaceae bacterium]
MVEIALTVNPDEKLVMYCLTVLIVIAPLAFWGVLYLAVAIRPSVVYRCDHATPKSPLVWLDIGISAVHPILCEHSRLDAWPLAAALGAFSGGLLLPEAWVKARADKQASAHS